MFHDRKYQEEASLSRMPRVPTPPQNIIVLALACTLLAVIMLAALACGIVFNPY